MKREIEKFLIRKLKSTIAIPNQNKVLLLQYSLLEEIAHDTGIDLNTIKSNQKILFEIIGDLKDKNILVQGNIGSKYDSYHLWLTDHGMKCLNEDTDYIYDPQGFIEKLEKEVPDIDPVAELYFIECVMALRENLILSATVCLGACSEKIILNLIDSYINSTYGGQVKEKIQKSRAINTKFNEFYKNVSSNKKAYKTEFPEIEDYLEKILVIFKNIKENRNDAGHPTGKSFDRDELECFIRLFSKYASMVEKLNKFYIENKITMH